MESMYKPSGPSNIPPTKMDVFFAFFYALFLLANVITNSLILVVINRRPSLQNFHFVALGNLALVDIFIALTLPIKILKTLFHYFPIGPELCSLYLTLPSVYSIVFVLTLVSLALVRLRAQTSFHFGPREDSKVSVLIMIFIWTVAALIGFPNFIFSGVHSDTDGEYCIPTWPSLSIMLLYQNITTFLPLLIGSIVIITSLLIAKRRQNERVVEEQEKRVQLDRRFDCMILIVWTIFFLLELSYGIITSLALLNGHEIIYQVVNIGVKVLYIFELISESYKIFLYRRMDGHFRKELSTMLRRN